MAKTVSENIQHDLVTHQVYLERYKNYEENKMLKILRDADKELTESIASRVSTGTWTEYRQEKLLESIKDIEARYDSIYQGTFKEDLKAFGEGESAYAIKVIDRRMKPFVDVEWITPSANQIWSAAESSFLIMDHGVTLDLDTVISGLFGKRADIIEQSLRRGFLLGKTSDEMVRELMGSVDKPGNMAQVKASVERIVRTSTSHMANVARNETYKQNSDTIKGYKWVSTLDTKTSPLCQDLDGRCWYYGEAPAGAYLLPYPIKPPAHWHCRSTTVPILASWKDLGINIAEAPEGTRSSLDGYVPQSMTYKEWLTQASEKVQKDVLGPTRYNMFKNGTLAIDNYIKDGKKLTLDQLKNL